MKSVQQMRKKIKQNYFHKVVSVLKQPLMTIDNDSPKSYGMLPYNGEKLEFIAKNLRVPLNSVFDILSVINISADDFVLFIINKRLTNRERYSENYTSKWYR
jgi:hypothetical protein